MIDLKTIFLKLNIDLDYAFLSLIQLRLYYQNYLILVLGYCNILLIHLLWELSNSECDVLLSYNLD